jgi:hypothetical protein
MKCKQCGLPMELWQSSTDENGNLYLSYRCSCGYQDSQVVGRENENLPTTDETDELKNSPKIKKSVNKWD